MSALLRGPGLSLSVVPVKVMRGSLYHRLSAVSDAIEWEGALREMGASRCICCMFLFFTLVASCALSGLLSQACQIDHSVRFVAEANSQAPWYYSV